ncbi:hypothetical protein GCM10027048_13970 [Hymenobacter coalescens]
MWGAVNFSGASIKEMPATMPAHRNRASTSSSERVEADGRIRKGKKGSGARAARAAPEQHLKSPAWFTPHR